MSAKPSKQSANPPPPARPSPAPAPTAPADAVTTSWIDSSDPRKQMWGKIILIAVWIYVGALCLLALDQTFHWGIFGPKVPPVP